MGYEEPSSTSVGLVINHFCLCMRAILDNAVDSKSKLNFVKNIRRAFN